MSSKTVMGSEIILNRHLRIQVLDGGVIRIEERGPRGFEDRPTFAIQQRIPADTPLEQTRQGNEDVLRAGNIRLVFPTNARGLDGIRIERPDGSPLGVLDSDEVRRPKAFPSPSDLPPVWVLGDVPRAVPPPPGSPATDSHWDLDSGAMDAYLFFPADSDYPAFRESVLELTGRIPLVPLYTLGIWYSRYHPYSEESAMAVIDRFRTANIPLDVFVLDTDWRVGASCGYGINRDLFPDLGRFISRAHERHIRIMLNDHPEPKGASALDPVELAFRRDGLRSLLDLGVDLWWFDRNWHTCLHPLMPGIEKEVWGMHLYREITREARPKVRPLTLSNADGIHNGRLDAPPHPAVHRYPVWWTGDTLGVWEALEAGVRNGVDSGIVGLLPYVHEDLGGHHEQPGKELYVRFMQFGAFSPVTRIHCNNQVHRYPWRYGADAEQMVGDVFRLRLRLLPMLYAAVHAAHRTGVPLMRRCDLEWPEEPAAADATQYLLGDDLLAAPVIAPAESGTDAERSVWIPPGEWQDAWTGKRFAGPQTVRRRTPLCEIPVYLRCGGIIASIPQRYTTGAAVWPELVLDVLMPSEDVQTEREFMEDDGISASGESAVTRCRLRRSGRRLKLTLDPEADPAGRRPLRRRVTLRIHLPPGTAARAGQDNWRRLEPDSHRLAGLFAGPGQRPPTAAGDIMEWSGDIDAGAAAAWELALAPG